MAATFETRVLENGSWVTRRANLDAAVEATSIVDEPEETSNPPMCGLLSRTVLHSPQVNKILPVRLRSKGQNDIAFIHDHTVTIRELLDDGQTRVVKSHMDMGQRIRNAVVVGELRDAVVIETRDDSQDHSADFDLNGITSAQQSNAPNKTYFPPQMLICILESGELVTVHFIKDEPVAMRIPAPVIPHLGHYFVVDPRSRYMVAAGFEDVLVIYELESWATLRQIYESTGTTTSVVKSTKLHPIKATILDVQFLYPRTQDEDHVILMALTCSKSRDGRSEAKQRYTTWDWMVGEDLSAQLKENHRQSIITEGIPIFCIPLRAQHAFYIVCESHIIVVTDTLSGGGGRLERVEFAIDTSTLHHGKRNPLWTAWSRAYRSEKWWKEHDTIYLAREDGKMQSLEIDADTLMPLMNEHEKDAREGLGFNIGTAFATTYDKFADVIIVGGSSGPGGIFKIEPREFPELMSTIEDWTPVLDMTTTSDFLSWEDAARQSQSNEVLSHGKLKRDRLFLASGRGKQGCVVEPRYGIKAKIGLELDLEDPAKDVWLLPDSRSEEGGMNLVVALPHSTQVLNISQGFDDVTAESSDTTSFDLRWRTLYVSCAPSGHIVQISERTISLITPSQRSRHSFENILGVPDAVVEQATRRDNLVVVTTSTVGEGTRLHTLRIEQMDVVLVHTRHEPMEATCLAIIMIADRQVVVAGMANHLGPMLCLYPADELQGKDRTLWVKIDNLAQDCEPLEPLISISTAHEDADAVSLVSGTRCGRLISILVRDIADDAVIWSVQRFGNGPVRVFPEHVSGEKDGATFAACDNVLTRVSKPSLDGKTFRRRQEVILPVNLNDPSLDTPPVHAVSATQVMGTTRPLYLLLSGTQVFFTELDTDAGPVTRTLPLGRSPTRLIYSETWKCLIVALTLSDNKGIDLAFINPDKGASGESKLCTSISKSISGEQKEGPLLAFDTPGDRVLALQEWVFFKGGKKFSFIIVGMQSCKLAVVSVVLDKEAAQHLGRRLTHSNRWRIKNLDGPVSAVVTDETGFICCAGRTLQRYVLEDRKLVAVKQFELDSPAVSLELHGGNVYALTQSHSLEVIDYKRNPNSQEMSLLHCDSVSRLGNHMIQVGPMADRWPISLIADAQGSVTGIWTPKGQKSREFETVFSGKLSNAVRKFVRAHCRAPYSGVSEQLDQARLRELASTADDAEILGVSLNGRLRHFKLLPPDLWEVLWAIQRLTGPSAADKIIDGDALALCLRKRLLEATIDQEGQERLMQMLHRLEYGVHVGRVRRQNGGVWDWDQACKLSYWILECLLRPLI